MNGMGLFTTRGGRCISHLSPLALVAAVQGGGAAVGHGEVIAGAQRMSWQWLGEEKQWDIQLALNHIDTTVCIL